MVARTSLQALVWLCVAWSPAHGIENSTSPCDSVSFSVQLKPVCPREPGEIGLTFEEAKNPSLVVRFKQRASSVEPVWAGFGENPYRIERNFSTLFSKAIPDAAIFTDQGRESVQVAYPKSVSQTPPAIEIGVCEDPRGRCEGIAPGQWLTPRPIVIPGCQAPPVVVVPVYSGCR